ncbi:hypothetical protein BH24GEM3_BH24GEM3_06870 [soil metagenome]
MSELSLRPKLELAGSTHLRVRAAGKHLYVGPNKFFARGVTYGTFAPDANGDQFPAPEVVESDFAKIAAHGMNSVRTYTVPPRWLLDAALRHDLRVMVGLPWEQHIAFLDERERVRDIERRVREGVRSCAGHPAVLCYAIGNEIPASVVRWYGARRVERFLERLYRAAKREDPEGLVTYVNYPTTEYLDLPFLDFVCFNVYLETEERLNAYLARLHNLAGDRPLLMAELGLDSRRNGNEAQARVLDWQVRATFAAGCAGMFVFAWTDEWYRGGFDIDDWDFGLTDRQRSPKPALAAVSRAFAEVPFPPNADWPRISVVVCCYNGAATLQDCLEGLRRVEYPDYEVIVVDDGSTDVSPLIAAGYPEFRLIRTPNRGLSAARNTGMTAATGEIVAYIDSDAFPDPDWLSYLAVSFRNSEHAGIGGPNIAPAGDSHIADCVANAPGGPVHVLLSDTEAEHIPGVNMAYRKWCLQAIGGFDPQYRAAGDDVDVCWRLQEREWTLGFTPAAVVWHHCRDSIRTYWKQQKGYGKAEALLERKWPEKYNSAGHLKWSGRLYSQGLTRCLDIRRGRIYGGTWGSALFQSVYQPATGFFASLPMMPEWYLLIAMLAGLSVLGVLWQPLLLAVPLLGLALLALLVQAGLSASRAVFTSDLSSFRTRAKLYVLTAYLHLLQPLARLWGRLEHGLSPWRRRGSGLLGVPVVRTHVLWSEDRWQSPEEKLYALESVLRAGGTVVLRGGEFDRWDLEVRGGALGRARLRVAVEEHGAGKQLFRFRVWPRLSLLWLSVAALAGALTVAALADQVAVVAALLGAAALLLPVRMLYDAATALGAVRGGIAALAEPAEAVEPVVQPMPELVPAAIAAPVAIPIRIWEPPAQLLPQPSRAFSLGTASQVQQLVHRISSAEIGPFWGAAFEAQQLVHGMLQGKGSVRWAPHEWLPPELPWGDPFADGAPFELADGETG